MRCRVLIRKLSFLQRVVNSNSASLSGTALLALSDDTASICLVRECRELEEVFRTHFTQEILSDNAPPLREVKDAIHERDRTKLTAKCSEKAPMIAAVARRIIWSRLWDSELDLGDKSVKGLQYLSRAMSHHGCGNHPCPLCDTAPLPATVLDHLLDCHSSSLFLNPTLSSDGLIDLLSRTARARGNASTLRFNFLMNIFIKWRSGNEAMTSLQLSFYSSRLRNAMTSKFG